MLDIHTLILLFTLLALVVVWWDHRKNRALLVKRRRQILANTRTVDSLFVSINWLAKQNGELSRHYQREKQNRELLEQITGQS